jgi:hypothetical protein
MNTTKRILILSAYKPIGVLIDIHLRELAHEDIHFESVVARCSDEIEVDEKFDITFVNETDLFQQLSENKNLLIKNLGKIVVFSDYKSNINRLKGNHPDAKFIKKEESSGFSGQIKRSVIRELGLIKPMEVLVE